MPLIVDDFASKEVYKKAAARALREAKSGKFRYMKIKFEDGKSGNVLIFGKFYEVLKKHFDSASTKPQVLDKGTIAGGVFQGTTGELDSESIATICGVRGVEVVSGKGEKDAPLGGPLDRPLPPIPKEKDEGSESDGEPGGSGDPPPTANRGFVRAAPSRADRAHGDMAANTLDRITEGFLKKRRDYVVECREFKETFDGFEETLKTQVGRLNNASKLLATNPSPQLIAAGRKLHEALQGMLAETEEKYHAIGRKIAKLRQANPPDNLPPGVLKRIRADGHALLQEGTSLSSPVAAQFRAIQAGGAIAMTGWEAALADLEVGQANFDGLIAAARKLLTEAEVCKSMVEREYLIHNLIDRTNSALDAATPGQEDRIRFVAETVAPDYG